jgi:hypothetical protein
VTPGGRGRLLELTGSHLNSLGSSSVTGTRAVARSQLASLSEHFPEPRPRLRCRPAGRVLGLSLYKRQTCNNKSFSFRVQCDSISGVNPTSESREEQGDFFFFFRAKNDSDQFPLIFPRPAELRAVAGFLEATKLKCTSAA